MSRMTQRKRFSTRAIVGLLVTSLTFTMCTFTMCTVQSAFADETALAVPDTVQTTDTTTGAQADASDATDTAADAAAEAVADGSTKDAVADPQHMWNQNDDASQARPRARSAMRTQWTTRDGVKTFLHGNNEVFASPAAQVIDVSAWQGSIDWDKVKQSGIDGVILRLGYCNNLDSYFERNLREVRRLKIPYGIYLYSYADNAKWGAIEGDFVARQMNRYKLDDMTYPMFYDLEEWSTWDWEDGQHSVPTTTAQYNTVVNAFLNAMAKNGRSNVRIYSYLYYFNTRLNHPNIMSRAGWVAQYNSRCDYMFPGYGGARGWQYTQSGDVNGIDGAVDMNAFDMTVFKDVNRSTPHYADIVWVWNKQIARGFADGTYRGMNTVVRQDMAAFLRRLAAQYNVGDAKTWKPSDADWKRFRDVNRGTPHAEDILWLAHARIADGYADGTFRGTVPVYRQDMAAFLKRLADQAHKSAGVTAKGFKDVNGSTPHAAEIGWLAGAGIAQGYADGTFRGMTVVYRQDMAAFLHRLGNRLGV